MKWDEEISPCNLQTSTNFSKYRESQVPELDQKMEGQAAKISKAIQESSTTYALMLKNVFLYIMSRSSFLRPQRLLG
jgi:hypothetical protein